MPQSPVVSRPLASALAVIATTAALLMACTTQQARRLRRFEQTLDRQDSATAALREWCAAEQIADPSRIVAMPVAGPARSEPADLRTALAVAADEPLGYRHVRLVCGSTVLSEAHNWYVPTRLDPAMNAQLGSTDTPFGTVAAPLGFHRERLATIRGQTAECPPGTVLSHHALLRLPDGRPLAFLVECYSDANLRPPSERTGQR